MKKSFTGSLILTQKPDEGEIEVYDISYVVEYSQVHSKRHVPIGFIKYSKSQEVFFLREIVLNHDFQGQGFASMVVYMAAKQQPYCNYLMFLTQSSLMYKAMRPLCVSLYPDFLKNPSEDVTKHVSNLFGAYDPQRPIVKGYFGHQQLEVMPENYTQHKWDKFCNYQMGDAVICIGHFNGEVISAQYPYDV